MEKRSNDPDNIQGVRDDQSTCSNDDDGTGSDQKARSNSSTNVSEEDNASVGDDNFPQSGNVIFVRSYDDTFDKRTTDDGCTDGNGFEKNSMNAQHYDSEGDDKSSKVVIGYECGTCFNNGDQELISLHEIIHLEGILEKSTGKVENENYGEMPFDDEDDVSVIDLTSCDNYYSNEQENGEVVKDGNKSVYQTNGVDGNLDKGTRYGTTRCETYIKDIKNKECLDNSGDALDASSSTAIISCDSAARSNDVDIALNGGQRTRDESCGSSRRNECVDAVAAPLASAAAYDGDDDDDDDDYDDDDDDDDGAYDGFCGDIFPVDDSSRAEGVGVSENGHELGISSRASGNCGDSTSLVGSVDGDGGLFAAFGKQNCGGVAGNPDVGRFDSLGGSTCDVLNATLDNGALLDDNHSGVKVGRDAAYVDFACHVEDENDNNNDKDSDDDDDDDDDDDNDDDDVDDDDDDDDDDPGAQYHPEEMTGCPETNELIVFGGKDNLSKGGIFHEIDVEIVTCKLTLKTKISFKPTWQLLFAPSRNKISTNTLKKNNPFSC